MADGYYFMGYDYPDDEPTQSYNSDPSYNRLPIRRPFSKAPAIPYKNKSESPNRLCLEALCTISKYTLEFAGVGAVVSSIGAFGLGEEV